MGDTLNLRAANIRENGEVGVIFYHFGAVMHILPCFFPGCQDTYYSGCPKWAAAGDCKSNEKWMKDFCKKSCNSCRMYYIYYVSDVQLNRSNLRKT